VITLITGGPGLGKTALAVSMLLHQYQGRPVFSNIRGLTLDHSPLPKLEDWTFEERNAQGTSEFRFAFPPGSVIVIDECQQFFRPRASSSRVPPYVSAFETHRHQGIDFILITQGSRLVDANLRALVKGGLHIFLRTSYLGRYRYEKSEVIDEESKASYSLATRRKYVVPKEAFPYYKSAELHTKPPKARMPFAVLIIVGSVVVGGALAYKVRGTMTAALEKDKPAPPSGPAAATTAQPVTPPSATGGGVVPEKILEATTPRDLDNPLSAPLYAAVVPPVVAPEIQGCIASKRSCTCYSQQQTPVWVPPAQCRERAAGRYFDPYRQPPKQEVALADRSQGADKSVVSGDKAETSGKRRDSMPEGVPLTDKSGELVGLP
jgi:zona occludens toxin